MSSDFSKTYEKWISKGEYKKAIDLLKINPHLDVSKTLYYELKNFENPLDTKQISEDYFKSNLKKINYQLNNKINSMIKPATKFKRRSLVQFFYRHFENKN